MSSANVGWMFYKEAFKKLESSNYPRDMKAVNYDILNAQISNEYSFPKGTHHAIELKTTYPGLVIGSGYPHALKDNKENFNFGFFFDHTTGMPIIPGSTVKGVLRSLFGQNKNERHKEQKEELIASFLPEKAQGIVAAITKVIFEGINFDGTRQSPYERDIFLDAYVIETESKLLDDDSITPHASPFKDPVPNKMLKLAPGVTIRFAFELHDIVDANGEVVLSADEKEDLFLNLLLWHGIGAKTNVGYGQFEDVDIASFRTKRAGQKILDDALSTSPTQKILDEYDNNIPNIVGAYHQGLKERVSDFLDDFKKEILVRLEEELKSAKNKKKPKIEARIKKVKAW